VDIESFDAFAALFPEKKRGPLLLNVFVGEVDVESEHFSKNAEKNIFLF